MSHKFKNAIDSWGGNVIEDIAIGTYPNVSLIHKFGFSTSVGTTEETCWFQGGDNVYPAEVSIMTVSSSLTTDVNTTGTGAWTVEIEGLDANWNFIALTVNMNGQTGVTLPTQLMRVFRAKVLTAGSNGENNGVIYVGTGTITTGIPATICTSIGATLNQSLQAFYTVPANKIALLTYFSIATASATPAYLTARLVVRPFGQVFQTHNQFITSKESGPTVFDGNTIHEIIPEKSDIEFRGTASSGTVDMSTMFHMLLIDDPHE